MYIFKNALQNLLRNRGRNLMIAIIIFVMIASAVTALMINNTSGGVIDDYKSRFGSEVSLTPDMQKLQEEAQANSTNGLVRIQRPVIAPEDLIAFGESEYLKEAVFTASSKGNSEQLKAIDEEKGGGGGPMRLQAGPGGAGEQETLGREYFFRLLANQYDDFESGLRELSEGEFPENEGECIVSADLLENSGLSIGDKITVESALDEMGDEPGNETYTDFSWELTIVGSYLDATDEYQSSMMENAYTNRRNEILTTFETLSGKMVSGLNGIQVDATYYLQNPDMLEDFTAELRSKGLDDTYNVTTDAAAYERIVGPVEALKGISVIFVILVLVFGGVILALLTSIAIRERKYEIGVLRAMGMKKGKVVLGLWSEMLVITGLCIFIGLGAGLLAAQPITDTMLDRQVAALEEAENANNNGFPGGVRQGMMFSGNMGIGPGPGQSDAEPLGDMDVSLDLLTIAEIIGIGLLLSSFAGIIATRKIAKYEPIKILMERN